MISGSYLSARMLLPFNRLGLRLGRRTYTVKSGASNPRESGRTQFDKSMLKPALVVIIFGSMLNHVSNQQKRYAELERRYDLKVDILEDLIGKAKKGDTNIDVDDELQLVNKLFSRYTTSKNVDIREEAEKLRGMHDSQTYSRKEALDSLNRSTGTLEQESLDDVLKSIIEEVDDSSLMMRDKNRFIETREPPNQTSRTDTAEEIIKDGFVLREEAKKESEFRNYEPSTEIHLIVENPGELSNAAQGTKVTKFL